MKSHAERRAEAQSICDNPEYDVDKNALNDLLKENRRWGFKTGWDARSADLAEGLVKIYKDFVYNDKTFEALADLEVIIKECRGEK